jgi:hypothetical protein
MLYDSISLKFYATVIIQLCHDCLLAEIHNTVHSCSRQGVDPARLTSERPKIFIADSKTFTLLEVHSQV